MVGSLFLFLQTCTQNPIPSMIKLYCECSGSYFVCNFVDIICTPPFGRTSLIEILNVVISTQ